MFEEETRCSLARLIKDKRTARLSVFSWLREPDPRIAHKSLSSILDKLAHLRATRPHDLRIDPAFEPRLAQFAKEGIRYTVQAFQQMGRARRRVILFATLRALDRTLTDAGIAMFSALVGRAHLRARKRLEQALSVSAADGRERLIRVANILDALAHTARYGGDMLQAVEAIASLDVIEEDAGLIRRSAKPTQNNIIAELGTEYGPFKRLGPLFLKELNLHGHASTQGLREALNILRALAGDWRYMGAKV